MTSQSRRRNHSVLPLILEVCAFVAACGVAALADAELDGVIDRYVAAIGGREKIAAVRTQVTRGIFDNGRGLKQSYVTAISPPRIATIIGRQSIDESGGSGRGYDGNTGWDKNFVGTGLRALTGSELAELARTADPFPAAHLRETCESAYVDNAANAQDASIRAVFCARSDRVERWHFDRETGLVKRVESSNRDGSRPLTIYFDDYRLADGILTPFGERIVVPGANITYMAETVRFNEPVAPASFVRPQR